MSLSFTATTIAATGIICSAAPITAQSEHEQHWQLSGFERIDAVNPILTSSPDSTFYCPVQEKEVHWEGEHIFNPGAVVRDGKVYIFYRAEDDYGTGIGQHTSRIGVAVSDDGLHFDCLEKPALFPDNDDQKEFEFPGGCEDPRVVETDMETYVMTYTQWNREVAVLGVATSPDLIHWTKQGYAFEGKLDRRWSKSGSIVCKAEGERLIATKIDGKYWMYWGEGYIYAATSDDLICWKPLCDTNGEPIRILEPRDGKFDSKLVEAGPPAILTEQGIVLLYNGKNDPDKGDPTVTPKAYSAGQVLFDISNPAQILNRSDSHFLTPERAYEKTGQYQGGTVFIQGLVHFQNKWFLYYGTADSAIGVAVSTP